MNGLHSRLVVGFVKGLLLLVTHSGVLKICEHQSLFFRDAARTFLKVLPASSRTKKGFNCERLESHRRCRENAGTPGHVERVGGGGPSPQLAPHNNT